MSAPATDCPSRRQRRLLDYLDEHGPCTQHELASVLGETADDVGVTLSVLAWRDDVKVSSRRDAQTGLVRWSTSR